MTAFPVMPAVRPRSCRLTFRRSFSREQTGPTEKTWHCGLPREEASSSFHHLSLNPPLSMPVHTWQPHLDTPRSPCYHPKVCVPDASKDQNPKHPEFEVRKGLQTKKIPTEKVGPQKCLRSVLTR